MKDPNVEPMKKETKVLSISSLQPEAALLAEAAAVLRTGGLVSFPTETVYGLGADAANEEAIKALFAAKGRPTDNPLIVHVADQDALADIIMDIPPKAKLLIKLFWPGPLTLVMKKRPSVPAIVSGGLSTIGVRMPDHKIALALIRAAGLPLAAPSANRSGRPSPTSAEHVADDLAGRIDLIVDGGDTGVGLESTVLDMTIDPPVLLRPGGVTLEELMAAIGSITVDRSVDGMGTLEVPRSPGTKYLHYAPNVPVILVEGELLSIQAKIRDLVYEYVADGRRVGIMCSAESRGAYEADVILEYGSREEMPVVATYLFRSMRAFERHGVDVILVEGVPATGIGLAIMNRLRRAAGGQVVQV